MDSIKKNSTRKTTSHKRRIVIYLPAKEMMETWSKEANKSGMTTSSFIQSIVNNYFENGNVLKSQKSMEKQLQELHQTIQQLRSENIELSKRVKMLDSLTDRQEQDLKLLRTQAFLNNDTFSGVRTYEKRLIELLKEKKNIKEHEILDLIHVDPNDFTMIKALNKQLENLLDYGIIKMYKGGYQWEG